MDKQSETLGSVLRAAREHQGLGQRQLARLLDVSPARVNRWESDSDVPTAPALVKLSEQLELRASNLFALAGVPVPADRASLPAMLRADYGLPAEDIAEIQAHIETIAERHRSRPAE